MPRIPQPESQCGKHEATKIQIKDPQNVQFMETGPNLSGTQLTRGKNA